MIILKKNVELCYRIGFLIVAGICLLLHFDINNEYYNTHAFSFFTVQSNIFCFVIMSLILIKYALKRKTVSDWLYFFKGMALTAIICTFLVYHFCESCKKYDLTQTGLLGIPPKDLLAHYVVPLMFFLDWIVFQPKGNFKWWYIAGWLVFPITYLTGFLTRCQCNGPDAFCNVKKFPYFFLDYETLGIQCFCAYIVMLAVTFACVNALIVLLDQYLSKKEGSNN